MTDVPTEVDEEMDRDGMQMVSTSAESPALSPESESPPVSSDGEERTMGAHEHNRLSELRQVNPPPIEVATEVCDPPESERLRPESSDGVSSYRGIPIVLTLPSGEPHRHFIRLRQLSTLGDLHAEVARTCARLRIHTEGGFQLQFVDARGRVETVSKSTPLKMVRKARELKLLLGDKRNKARNHSSAAAGEDGVSSRDRARQPASLSMSVDESDGGVSSGDRAPLSLSMSVD